MTYPSLPQRDELREEIARAIDEADNRWQHGIGSGGFDPNGPPLWLADAVLDLLAARRESLAEQVKALADEWTHATCQTDGAPCSWHRVSAECADELTALLDPSETEEVETVHYATFVEGGTYRVADVTCPLCRKLLAQGQAL